MLMQLVPVRLVVKDTGVAKVEEDLAQEVVRLKPTNERHETILYTFMICICICISIDVKRKYSKDIYMYGGTRSGRTEHLGTFFKLK